MAANSTAPTGRQRRQRWQAPARPQLTPLKRWAAEKGIPYTSVRDIVRRGEIPVIKIGRAQYIEHSDGDRWITSRKENLA
jgi:hypothetical protein